jgi:hypothetical protein
VDPGAVHNTATVKIKYAGLCRELNPERVTYVSEMLITSAGNVSSEEEGSERKQLQPSVCPRVQLTLQ